MQYECIFNQSDRQRQCHGINKRRVDQGELARREMRSVSTTRASAERQTIRTVFSPANVPITSGHPCESTASAIGCAPLGKVCKTISSPTPSMRENHCGNRLF